MCIKHDRKRIKRTVLLKDNCVSLLVVVELSQLPCFIRDFIHGKYQLVCEHLHIEESELYCGLLEFKVNKFTVISVNSAYDRWT